MMNDVAAKPQRPCAFSKDWSPEVAPIVRPHKHENIPSNVRVLQTDGAGRDTRRILLYVDAWRHCDDHARPNWTMTINLPSPIPFRESGNSKSVHAYVGQYLLNDVRTAMKKRSVPWRWISAVEVKGGNYHVHALVHFPSRRVLTDVFFRVWKKVAGAELQTRSAFEECVFQRSSGTPIFATPVDPERQYDGTGRKGVEGYADYMIKNLSNMTSRRRFSQEIGSPIIISQSVTRLVAKNSFCLRSVKYTPASVDKPDRA